MQYCGVRLARTPHPETMARYRFPAFELLAAQHGAALARSERALTEAERSLLSGVFGESLDLDSIRIVETWIANSPTTLGNSIRIRPGAEMDPATLVHEAAHVWQFQTQGTAYVSDSAFHQGMALLKTGSRSAAYEVEIVPGQSIYGYTAEQQAMIVEYAYGSPAWRENPEVARMMEEVRAARPLPWEAIVAEASEGAEKRPPLFRIDS